MTAFKYNRPKGTQDFVPPQSERKFAVEMLFRKLAGLYGYREIVTPTFEHTELFVRSSGVASDIVTKEMYTFNDRADRSLTLKPEGTPGVIRALLENGLRLPCRLFYIAPFFRYSRPQRGRYREFYQLGVEALGEASPVTDAEVVHLGAEFFFRLKITDCVVRVNSIGCRLCRPVLREKLIAYLRGYQDGLCPDCNTRIELNPLRIFDCKNTECRQILVDAPVPIKHLCPDCQSHFQIFLDWLKAWGVRFEVDPYLVRGLDYYNRTTFEFVAGVLGEQISLGGGGRYDYLIEELGGSATPAVGMAIGLERTLLSMPEGDGMDKPRKLVFIVWTSENELRPAWELVNRLREAGIPAQLSYDRPKIRHQFHIADISGACIAVIVGELELSRGVYGIKNLKTGEQHEVSTDMIVNYLGSILNS